MEPRRRKAVRKRKKTPKRQEKALIRLRSKPKRPKRRRIERETEVDGGDRLSVLLERLGFVGDDPGSEIYFKTDYYSADGGSNTLACFDRMQTAEEYGQDLADYQKRLDAYSKWYKENKETILAEISRRRVAAEERKRHAVEAERARVEEQFSKLNKYLQNLP